jgi:hypothetical protein
LLLTVCCTVIASWATSPGFHPPAELSSGSDVVAVDVGCGQGYFSAALLSLWAPQLGVSPSSLHDLSPRAPCGPCKQCQQKVICLSKAAEGRAGKSSS